MFQTVHSCILEGLRGAACEIECSIQPGFPCFHVLGLSAVNATAAHEKMLAALKASSFPLPQERITLNIRPPHSGNLSSPELGMAAGILAAQRLVPSAMLEESVFIGELSLDGNLLPLSSSYYYAAWAKENGYKRLFMPAKASEIPVMDGLEIVPVISVKDLVEYLRGKPKPASSDLCPAPGPASEADILFPSLPGSPELEQIIGQEDAKRALVIAAAGFHNLLLMGPPGIGKSMLASSAGKLLSLPSEALQREIAGIYSFTREPFPKDRPLRAPHHTIPPSAFLGGGSPIRPGEISLAHGGILFLDEVAEYPRSTLEALRLPLENHAVQLDRLREHAEFPADFLLIAGMNPCPCGFYPSEKRCHCTESQIEAYQKRVSGPLSDRIDMIAVLSPVENTSDTTDSLSTKEAQKQIKAALERARLRQGYIPNARIAPEQLDRFCTLSPSARLLSERAFQMLGLSMRGYHRFLRMARTVADLSDHEIIEETDVLEAMHYSDKSLLK